MLPEETIIATDAGNFSGWPQRYYPFRRYRTQLSPGSGSMGQRGKLLRAVRLSAEHQSRPSRAGQRGRHECGFWPVEHGDLD